MDLISQQTKQYEVMKILKLFFLQKLKLIILFIIIDLLTNRQ